MDPQSPDRFIACQHKLYRYSLSLAGNAADAQDIYQDSLLKIWQLKDQWQSWRNFEAYAMRLVKNTFLNHLQKENKKQHHLSLDALMDYQASDDTEARVILDDLKLTFMNLISRLPETQRDVIYLREIEELEYSEISEILEISEAIVKVSLFRARQYIKNRINGKQ